MTNFMAAIAGGTAPPGTVVDGGQPGSMGSYVYIWLNNENENAVEVYFDDFKVTHSKSPVVQMDDYYPFGLTFNSYQRENSVKNQYLYNGGSERQDELGLEIDLTKFRGYDPAMGRWWQLDPKTESLYEWESL